MRHALRAVAVALPLISLGMLVWPRGGATVPLYAARTGLMCANCHFDPNGGGPRNDFGFAFARNRHSLEPEDSTSAWHDLSVVNRVGDNMPVYFGLNHRVLLLGNTTVKTDSLDRLAFFNMENAIHIAFQPHPRLALVHTQDGATPRESFGWIGGFPWDGYIKIGAFRNPFGLRMDDHTVATRQGFLDFFTVPSGLANLVQRTFLPYDPRSTDEGIEVGATRSGFYGRVALTNGSSSLFAPPGFGNSFAEAKAVKLGYGNTFFHAAASFYDDYQKNPITFTLPPAFPIRRASRWGFFALTHYRRLALLGEIAAGTDEFEFSEAKRNLLAGFAEADYAPMRSVNFRFRYDHVNLDNRRYILISGPADGLNTHDRYSVEGEYVPVPFAELRWTLRFIQHKFGGNSLVGDVPDERQGYLQFHFSY
ncbi:MAG: hypothetical protein E6K73_01650 [Candidatus Eisenbacteria bacterium]|uniref:Uncharacterized protein n=1 Tax=Eiseniibacteriota bacterium TaxID=2212470 RepID=A0A538SPH3_UNCEI|nr:MAG: hypothetical protein E6K73_01650 [Candidatus Eisenbacteria bacterium]